MTCRETLGMYQMSQIDDDSFFKNISVLIYPIEQVRHILHWPYLQHKNNFLFLLTTCYLIKGKV